MRGHRVANRAGARRLGRVAEGLASFTQPGVFRSTVLQLMWDLLDRLRPDMSARTSQCGMVAISKAKGVALRRRRGGRHGLRGHIEGLRACGRVHECPACIVKIKAARGREIHDGLTRWADEHGRDCIALVTLTVSHSFGDELGYMRRGMSEAWRRVEQGRAFRAILAQLGVAGAGGFIRALEVTDGRNGWHPHMHFLVLSTVPLMPKCRRVRGRWRCSGCRRDRGESSAEGRAPRCLNCPASPFYAQLRDAWRAAVRSVLGPAFVPSLARGVDIQQADRAGQYLAKLGMEISAPGTKAARPGHRTYLDMLVSAARDGDADAWERSRLYVRDMKGAKVLFWSRGLKKRLGIGELTDEQLIRETESKGELVTTLVGPGHWKAVRSRPGARVELAEAAENGGAECVGEFVRLLTEYDAELRGENEAA